MPRTFMFENNSEHTSNDSLGQVNSMPIRVSKMATPWGEDVLESVQPVTLVSFISDL